MVPVCEAGSPSQLRAKALQWESCRRGACICKSKQLERKPERGTED